MKLMHLSDLHLGKRVNEFSMIEDQEYILKRIIAIADDIKPDAIIIAGDVYDKSIPSVEAVKLFDDFISSFSRRRIELFIISGNHDSMERVAFGGRIMNAMGVHISPIYNGSVEPITLRDGLGKVNFYLLPFVKPATVRPFFEGEEIESYTDAVRAAVSAMNVDKNERNVLVTHQFVTGAVRSESEDISVGGTDNVDAEVFDGFDYVALGHIHRPQKCVYDHIRYCGTPLKYSFSEVDDKKSVTIVELSEKGSVSLSFVPLSPLRDMREIRGTFEELTKKSFYENTSYPEDYLHITLTDEEPIPEAMSKLRLIYKNIMKLDYDNRRTRHTAQHTVSEDAKSMSPLDYFSKFYEQQNGVSMTEEQSEYMEKLIEKIWEDD